MDLLGEPAPDFSDPLGMLGACHRRMLALCDLLDRLPDWIERHGVDDEAIAAAGRVLRYFNTAAPLHHADEELDLFPSLEAEPELASAIATLRAEHEVLEALWIKLADALDGLLVVHRQRPSLAPVISPFCTAYRDHVAREDAELLPRAAELLSDDQLARLGARMAARRG